MTIEQLILQAIDQCMENADSEQKRIFCWMKAVLQYPNIEHYISEVKSAIIGIDKVSTLSVNKAIEFIESNNEYLIRCQNISNEDKEDMVSKEKIRLQEVRVRILGVLQYFGMLK